MCNDIYCVCRAFIKRDNCSDSKCDKSIKIKFALCKNCLDYLNKYLNGNKNMDKK